MSPSPPTAIFLHIPKTAGCSMQFILDREYPDTQRAEWTDCVLRLTESPRRMLPPVRLVSGHIPFGVHTLIAGPSRYFTMLRHPVERVISHYYHTVTDPYHPDHTLVVRARMSLRDSLEALPSAMCNIQVRSLCGLRAFLDDRVGEEELRQAQAHLEERFAAIGLTERFDESALLLATVFGWTSPCYVTQNVNAHRPATATVDEETRLAIEAANAADMALYRWAERRFERHLAELRPQLPMTRARFERANRLYTRVYNPLVRHMLRVTRDQLLAQGCRRVALYGAGRHTSRILRKTDFHPLELQCIVDDQPRRARLYGIPIVTPDQAERMNLDALILSSDAYEQQLMTRARAWAPTHWAIARIYRPDYSIPATGRRTIRTHPALAPT